MEINNKKITDLEEYRAFCREYNVQRAEYVVAFKHFKNNKAPDTKLTTKGKAAAKRVRETFTEMGGNVKYPFPEQFNGRWIFAFEPHFSNLGWTEKQIKDLEERIAALKEEREAILTRIGGAANFAQAEVTEFQKKGEILMTALAEWSQEQNDTAFAEKFLGKPASQKREREAEQNEETEKLQKTE